MKRHLIPAFAGMDNLYNLRRRRNLAAAGENNCGGGGEFAGGGEFTGGICRPNPTPPTPSFPRRRESKM
ncbi:MAG: hypothetical protein HAW59_07205 [Betaproteobacteria bacterium]|nr:hypothetical protein [Betaproteobacteria bacterium]